MVGLPLSTSVQTSVPPLRCERRSPIFESGRWLTPFVGCSGRILIKVVAELSEAGKIVPLGPCLDDALVLDAIDRQVACEEYPA